MFASDKIKLFWWSEIYLANKEKENFGDLIGKYLVEKISKKAVNWTHPKKRSFFSRNKPVYFTVGSILSQVQGKCIVWGSGIISKEIKINNAVFTAVRGPQTRKHLISLGYEVPEVYGDPALLMPMFFNPNRDVCYEVGIIPHYVDFEKVSKMYNDNHRVKIIDLMTNDVEDVCDMILQCKKVISSSLHGIIVAHSYGIPAIGVKFSDRIFGDGIKYQDYFESVGIENYVPEYIGDSVPESEICKYFEEKPALPKACKIKQLQKELLSACPFKD